MMMSVEELTAEPHCEMGTWRNSASFTHLHVRIHVNVMCMYVLSASPNSHVVITASSVSNSRPYAYHKRRQRSFPLHEGATMESFLWDLRLSKNRTPEASFSCWKLAIKRTVMIRQGRHLTPTLPIFAKPNNQQVIR
jgi:hypothetical protein